MLPNFLQGICSHSHQVVPGDDNDGRIHEEGIWGLSSISTDLKPRKHPNLDGGFSDSNLHRPQVVFGVLSDHVENKINFCLTTEVPGTRTGGISQYYFIESCCATKKLKKGMQAV